MVLANPTRTTINDDCYNENGPDCALLKNSGEPEHPTIKSFQSLVGSLLWVTRCTHPNITFAGHKDTRRSHELRKQDWKLAKKISWYLAGSKKMRLKMRSSTKGDNGITLESCSDADFAADKNERKSLTGAMVLLNGMPISWSSKKQGSISLSTMEGEFVAASEMDRDLLEIRDLLMELGLAPNLPVKIRVDNQAATRQNKGEASSLRANHIDVSLKFVNKYARRGIL